MSGHHPWPPPSKPTLDEALAEYEWVDDQAQDPHDRISEHWRVVLAAARNWHALPSLIRQFTFDIVMTERGMDDTDPDDQMDAADVVDAWMKHWDALSVTAEPEAYE